MGYLVINDDGLVINAIVWDGQSTYELPGCSLVPIDDVPTGVGIGWTRNGSDWVAPVDLEIASLDN